VEFTTIPHYSPKIREKFTHSQEKNVLIPHFVKIMIEITVGKNFNG